MIRTARHGRTRPTSRRPRWERLESRLVLSSILSIDPAPGATLARSPAAFHVEFDRPIADFTLGTSDVILDLVGRDGSLTPVFDDSNAPYEELDPDGAGLTFTLNDPLSPGTYRLIFTGGSSISALDGTWLSPSDGSDEALGDFTIARPGAGLSDAIDLGAIGPDETSVAGSLDFQANPSAVALYRITLPAGRFYRLGAEVTAARDGSSLNSALALFDSRGRLIASDDVGRPDAPSDPFLFAGLAPGTYYLGVSGTGNLPGQPGGYDVVSRVAGAPQTQPGGPFTLHLAADDADTPAALVDFRVLHADPLDPTPTGFALRFSAALFLGDSGSSVFDHATKGIELVDGNGRSWPIAAVNYDEAHAAISYLFRDRLPQGTYTLRLADSSPLADLAGNATISPTMPRGVLATFAVAPDTRTRQPDGSLAVPAPVLATVAPGARSEDLGPLTPDLALAGIERTLTIRPGETVALRFVNLYRDFYKLVVNHDDGPLHIDLVGPDGVAYDQDPGPPGQDNSVVADLRTGVYFARFTATGDAPVVLTTALSIGAFGWDSLLANGLGQGPALNLRLVSIDAPASFSLGDPASSGGYGTSASFASSGAIAGPYAEAAAGPSARAAGAVVLNRSGLPEAEAALVSSSSSGLSFDVGGAPVGLPSAGADHVAAVGPGGGAGSVAVALGGPGLGQSISSPFTYRGDFAPDDAPAATPPTEPPAPATDGSMAGEPATPLLSAPADEIRSPEDAPAKTDADVSTASWSAASPEIPAEASLSPASLAPAPPSADAEAGDQDAGISPWIFGIAGATAIVARQALRRLKSRRRSKPQPAGFIPAPHSVTTRVRV